jgi:hypothetical protein
MERLSPDRKGQGMAYGAPRIDTLTDFEPARLRPRHDGWTADRQRVFIATLAETGCISDACAAAGISPKSAYRLRAHPAAGAFVEAWDRALAVATGRLASIAFDRAIKGSTREMWKDGELVGEVRAPSDKLLMFLLTKLDARRFGAFAGMSVTSPDPLVAARDGLGALLDRLVDIDCPVEPLGAAHYQPVPLIDVDGFARPHARKA